MLYPSSNKIRPTINVIQAFIRINTSNFLGITSSSDKFFHFQLFFSNFLICIIFFLDRIFKYVDKQRFKELYKTMFNGFINKKVRVFKKKS